MIKIGKFDWLPSDEPQDRHGEGLFPSASGSLNKRTHGNRAKMLFLFLPFGAVSKQTLGCITKNDKETAYHFVRKGFITSGKISLSDTVKSKNIIYYSLTPKGLNYIFGSNQNMPEWFSFCKIPESFSIWGKLNASGLLNLINFQDSAAFFTMTDSGMSTLLTELWKGTPYALVILLGMKISISNKSSTMIVDVLIKGLLEYMKTKKVMNPNKIQEYEEEYNRIFLNGPDKHEKINLSGFYDYPQNRYCYCNVREIKFFSRSIKINLTNPNTYQDNCIGIMAGETQDISVYITSKYGFWHSGRVTKTGHTYHNICAARISNNPKRRAECRCTSAIVLCRNLYEMVNAIIDPYDLRRDNDKIFGDIYSHIYMVPMTYEGLRMIEILNEKDPLMNHQETVDDLKSLADIFPEIQYLSGSLINTETGGPCVNGVDLDVKEIYKALLSATNTSAIVTIICEDWQKPFYEKLITKWKTEMKKGRSKIKDTQQPEGDILLKTITIDYDDYETE